MAPVLHPMLAFLAVCSAAAAPPPAAPAVARTAHFEVYAQAGETSARSILRAFERLRAYFLQQTGFSLDNRPPVRVIAFRSRNEYARYQLRPAADAYYVGNENRDAIVLVAPSDGDIRVAAHEYAHFVLHANGLQLPPWLNEGLAEYFSRVRLNGRDLPAGPVPPPRSEVLRHHGWMSLSALLRLPADSPLREQRASVDLFYAESAALVDMLIASPAYHPRFSDLIAMVSSGIAGDQALASIYRRTLDEITADLRAWVEKRRIAPISLPSLTPASGSLEASPVLPIEWSSVLADLLRATGKLDRAQAAYEELAAADPANPDFRAALALLAFQQHKSSVARRHWRRALQLGVRDAAVCYQYAVLADAAGLAADEIRGALERAVILQPDFDNARYLLAHLDSNAGRYESAITQLRAMHTVSPARQFAYWSALADGFTQLGQRDEAKAAAIRAREHAANDEERRHALQLAEFAETDLNVQFAPDASGTPRLVTTRIPHNDRSWNPFIEPGDRIRRVEGRLRIIDCTGPATRIVVESSSASVTLTIADPLRVQMRNAPQEFTCGPQSENWVTVVYAAGERTEVPGDGIVRGMEFH